MLAIVWGLAILGIVLEVAVHTRRLSVALHLAMGWLAVIAAGPLIRSVHPDGLLLLALGGLTLLVSWPAFAPLYGWLRELPLLGDFRFPYKYRLLSTLALAVAAGVGVTHLQRALGRWPASKPAARRH